MILLSGRTPADGTLAEPGSCPQGADRQGLASERVIPITWCGECCCRAGLRGRRQWGRAGVRDGPREPTDGLVGADSWSRDVRVSGASARSCPQALLACGRLVGGCGYIPGQEATEMVQVGEAEQSRGGGDRAQARKRPV